MLQKVALLFVGSVLVLQANFLDDDMDGVANEDDLCPNSALTDIVDASGCKIEKVVFKKEHHFDLTVGLSYSRLDENQSQYAQSLSLGYYYGNFSAYFYGSNYDLQNGESGVGDVTVAFYYRRANQNVGYKLGAGSYIPTDSNFGNEIDYFLNLKLIYYRGKYDFSFLLQHTFMQDSGSFDSNRLSLSVGRVFAGKWYGALFLTQEESVYNRDEKLKEISVYGSYSLGKHWFVSGEIAKGLSASATDFSSVLNVGYYF